MVKVCMPLEGNNFAIMTYINFPSDTCLISNIVGSVSETLQGVRDIVMAVYFNKRESEHISV